VTQPQQVAAKAQLNKGSALGGKGLSELVYVLQHDAEPPLLSEGDTMLEVDTVVDSCDVCYICVLKEHVISSSSYHDSSSSTGFYADVAALYNQWW
jgi:hypothetical protein